MTEPVRDDSEAPIAAPLSLGAEVRKASPLAQFFGLVLMAVGGLIALLCGLCTSVVGIGIIASSFQSPSMLSSLGVLVIGLVPTAMGVGLFVAGRALYRGR